MWTVFLDIDGTLLRTQGAGLRAIEAILKRRYGIKQLPKIPVHGRTDFGIWSRLFLQLELQPPNDFTELISEYCDLLDENLLQQPPVILPCVHELVQCLHERNDVAVGLLTGNAKHAADVKIRHAKLDGFIEGFGGFGDVHANRNLVAEQAVKDARRHLPEDFDQNSVWVLGDSNRDISCARHIGASVMAVATGVQSKIELASFGPDVVVEDFSNIESIMARCFG